MATKPYLGGSAPEQVDVGCPMLYRVTIITRDPYEPGVVSISSTATVAGIQNATAFETAFKDDPLVEVIIRPDVIAYIRKKHPHLNPDVPLDP